MDKNLYEAFKLKYGFTPEAVMSLPKQEISKFTIDQIREMFSEWEKIYGLRNLKIHTITSVEDEKKYYNDEDDYGDI